MDRRGFLKSTLLLAAVPIVPAMAAIKPAKIEPIMYEYGITGVQEVQIRSTTNITFDIITEYPYWDYMEKRSKTSVYRRRDCHSCIGDEVVGGLNYVVPINKLSTFTIIFTNITEPSQKFKPEYDEVKQKFTPVLLMHNNILSS